MVIDQVRNVFEEPNSFVGRERELDELRRFVPSARAVTLCGPGGIGKTRLALRVLAELADDFPDGVWFIELGELRQPDLVVARVASVIGVDEEPGRPLLDTLADALRPRRLLLALDTCEHLIDSCARLCHRLLAGARPRRPLARSGPPPVPPAAGELPGAARARDQPRAAADGSRGRVAGAPAVPAAARRTRGRRGSDPLRGGAAVRRPGGGVPSRLCPRGRQRVRGERAVPVTGWRPAGYRASRRLGARAVRGSDRDPAGRPVPPAHQRRPDRARTPANAARGDRLEP